ncbi:MAG: hypothetical protein Q8L39_04760 [Burkholderiales bacterium]|nr:hypothetical protein [Burkholderiales bacterium]
MSDINLTQLKTDILADATLAPLAGAAGVNGDYPNSKDGTISAALNVKNVPANKSRLITARTLLAELNPVTAATILDKLESASVANTVIKWAMKFLTAEPGLDIGHLNTLAMLGQLVTANVITAAEAAALKGLSAVTISVAEQKYGRDVHNLDIAKCFGRVGLGS